jgi:hypothetical protein
MHHIIQLYSVHQIVSLKKLQNLTSMICDLDLNLTLQKDALFTYCITVLCFIAVGWPILFINCFQIIKQIWPPWPWPVRYPKIELTKSFLGSQWMHRPDYRKFWKFFMWFFRVQIYDLAQWRKSIQRLKTERKVGPTHYFKWGRGQNFFLWSVDSMVKRKKSVHKVRDSNTGTVWLFPVLYIQERPQLALVRWTIVQAQACDYVCHRRTCYSAWCKEVLINLCTVPIPFAIGRNTENEPLTRMVDSVGSVRT